MKKYNKNFKIILLVTVVLGVFFIFTETSSAIKYELLEPIGNISSDGSTDVVSYFTALFTWGVGIAGGLAVLMLVISGIQYMSPTESAKSDAKDRATMAIFGLILILAAVMILKEINPELINIGF